ncbi:MAG: mechanosensitive ion channel domain-containing protein [Methanoregulaceae archaeon]
MIAFPFLYELVTILSGILLAAAAFIIIRWLKKKAALTPSQLDDIILDSIGTPMIVIILLTSAYIAFTAFGPMPQLLQNALSDQLVSAVYIVIVAWITSGFFTKVIGTYGKQFAEKTESDLDDRMMTFLEKMIKYVIWFIAFLLILYTFRIDITPFLAGAGIAGLALALAAQEVLSNFFGGVVITLDKPFKVGDRVKVNEYFGDVIEVGPRSTRIQTLDYQIVSIPNATITSNVVVNYAMPDQKIKVRIPVSVAYGTDMQSVKDLLLAIAREAASVTSWVLSDPAPSVYFLEFGESSLNLQLILWADAYENAWEVQDYVNMRIDGEFRKQGIEIPFRQVDVHMRRPEVC